MAKEAPQPDVINDLAGIGDGDLLADLRAHRSDTLAFAQGSYQTLLEPDEPGGVSREERAAIGLRVATLERVPGIADFYRTVLHELGAGDQVIAAIELFPGTSNPGERMNAILRHTDLLTTSSRSGSPDAIEALKQAGLSARDIVTISQLIAYLSYQIRMVALLRAMKESA